MEHNPLTSLRNLLNEMEIHAHRNAVPILQPDGLDLLVSLIAEKQYRSILEIGTATGYSAIAFCQNPDVRVTTVERDSRMHDAARHNIALAGLGDRIQLLFLDALTMSLEGMETVDLLFIDAAKGQNHAIFDRFSPLVRSGGAIVIDNLSFHGFVEAPETILSRDRRQMVHKIQEFIEFIEKNDHYVTQIHAVGDGIGVCIKK